MNDDEPGEGPVDWTGDPLRDTLTYRWIENARSALELLFLDEAVRERYEDWIERHDDDEGDAGEPVGTEGDSMVVEQWTAENGGAVILSAGPRRNEFVLDVLSSGFEASVGLIFDVETHELLLGTLTRFSGSPEAGLIGGIEFGEMIVEEEASLLGGGAVGDEDDLEDEGRG
jgi:hypothetical protein